MSNLQKKIPDFDRCYTLVIENANAFPVQVTILGANQFLTAVNFGLPAGVTVTVVESSYLELLQESQLQPFIVGGMTITSSIPQLVQISQIRYRSSNGVIMQYAFHPFNYFSVNQYQEFLELYPLDITVNGEAQSQFNLLANSTVTTVLYVTKRIATGNILHNEPTTEVGSDLFPFFESSIVV